MFIRKITSVHKSELVLKNLNSALKNLGHHLTKSSNNCEESRSIIQGENPDLILLDIELSDDEEFKPFIQDVIEIYKIPFIIVSSKNDMTNLKEIKKLNPDGFLHTPINNYELEYLIISIFEKSLFHKLDSIGNKNNSFIFVKNKNSLEKISLQDIFYFKSDNIYVEIHSSSYPKILIRDSLNNIYKKLDSNFVRVHRSYIINLNRVQSVKSNSVLINNDNFPFTRKYKSLINKHFLND